MIKFSFLDIVSIGPLVILLGGALFILLLESFFSKFTERFASLITFLIFLSALFSEHFQTGSVNPLLSKWIQIDEATFFFTSLFLLIGIGITFLSHLFFNKVKIIVENTHSRVSQGEYYFLLITAVFGLLLIGSAADFLTLFLGMETLSIALYVLTGYMKKWEASHESAIKYFLLGALGAALLLYGIAFFYGALGTTNFLSLEKGSPSTLFLIGAIFVTAGLSFKAAIAPFHVWAPDVYEGAPTPVVAFMAVGTKAGAFAAFARVFLSTKIPIDPLFNEALSCLAVISLVYANFVALAQTDLRRFFAYSGISHAGFLLFPIIAKTTGSQEALFFYLAIYAISTIGAFAVIIHLDKNERGGKVNDLKGLFQKAPLAASILTLCLFTLAGIPPTAGFFAKLYVFKLVFGQGFIGLVVIGLLTTILSAYYYLRIVSVMLQSPSEEQITLKWVRPVQALSIAMGLAILFFSIYPEALAAYSIIN